MLPLLHEALRLAEQGAIQHRSLACGRLAATLAFAASGRGGAAFQMERNQCRARLHAFLGDRSGDAKALDWAHPSWDDVLKDRYCPCPVHSCVFASVVGSGIVWEVVLQTISPKLDFPT
jgi:hypothetical protein